ncbi:hypothetical protein C0Q70_02179 [Pomacea canaliculata]|uniref:HMG box domain-containing protein n=1 Tax=Pomacea canaliculata TaxID=400727 RepID=A0A2T7Q1K3_POMCA|nr:hypothetical protein C0Q70_02179 [Pomacea canaliculata]
MEGRIMDNSKTLDGEERMGRHREKTTSSMKKGRPPQSGDRQQPKDRTHERYFKLLEEIKVRLQQLQETINQVLHRQKVNDDQHLGETASEDFSFPLKTEADLQRMEDNLEDHKMRRRMIVKALACKWRNLKEKLPYEVMALQDRERYYKQMTKYHQKERSRAEWWRIEAVSASQSLLLSKFRSADCNRKRPEAWKDVVRTVCAQSSSERSMDEEWTRRKHTFQLPAMNLNYLSLPQKSIQDPLMWSHYVPGVSHHLVHSARHEGWVDLLPTDHTKATTRRKNDTMKEMCPGCEDLLCSSLTSPHPECPEEQEAQTTDQREAVAC